MIAGLDVADRIRLEYPELGPEFDDVVDMLARDLPPTIARTQARHVAARVARIRAGHHTITEEEGRGR